MSRKTKQAVIWFRFKFADTAAGRMQIQQAADKLFRLACVSERRTYTEEEVVGMAKEALEQANRKKETLEQAKRKQVFTPAEIMEARDQCASIAITQTNTDELPRVRIEWPTGEVREGVLKQNQKEPAG